MEEFNPTRTAVDAVAVSAQKRSDSTGVSSSSSPGTVTFSREQVVFIMQLASSIDLSKPNVLQKSGSSSLSNSEPSLSPPPPRWFEAHSRFSRPVANYLWHSPASESWETKRIGQESFIDFVRLHPAYLNEDNSVLPATELAIMEWIAYLGARNVHPKTLKSYLIDIRSLHVDAGYPSTACESPIVQCLIRGIKRVHSSRPDNPKLLITIDVLRQLCAATPSDGLQDVVFKAVITVAFAAFLRLSEFTVATAYDPATHLSRGSVQFLPDASSPTHVILTISTSKADPFRKGATILVAAAPGALTCPVVALKALFERDPRPPSAPLFSGLMPGQPLTRDHFTLFCYLILSSVGVDIARHSGLSFRRGAASSAEAVGYSEDEIRLLGRWRSDSDKLYRAVSRDRILQLSARLHSTELLPQTSEPPAA